MTNQTNTQRAYFDADGSPIQIDQAVVLAATPAGKWIDARIGDIHQFAEGDRFRVIRVNYEGDGSVDLSAPDGRIFEGIAGGLVRASWSDFAARKPNLSRRASMIRWLIDHPRHNEGNGFGPPHFRFAQNVKLSYGGILNNIPLALREAAYAVVDGYAGGDPQSDYDLLFEDFQREHGLSAGFGGRSGGWIVLYGEAAAELPPDKLGALKTSALRRLCQRVMAFDELCDACVTRFQSEVEAYAAYAPSHREGDRLKLPAGSEFQGLALAADLTVTVTAVQRAANSAFYHLTYIGVDGTSTYGVTAFEDQLEAAQKIEAETETSAEVNS